MTGTEIQAVKGQLGRVEQLLRKYGQVYHANLAMLAAAAVERDLDAGVSQLDSDEWWGDADSVAAIDLAIAGGFSPEARRDAAILRRELAEAYQLMVDHGVHNEKGEIMAAQFRKWLASHI